NLLREGVQIPNGQGGFTTTLNTEGFVSTPELLIRVSPTGFDASMVDEQEWADASFPETPFSMSWE
ncbi:MAG: hypothetical protein IT285_15955, partial [Bdellovibrionales bacterium]|nr:hypothetical protein [Bdellovibrionales bacterium]